MRLFYIRVKTLFFLLREIFKSEKTRNKKRNLLISCWKVKIWEMEDQVVWRFALSFFSAFTPRQEEGESTVFSFEYEQLEITAELWGENKKKIHKQILKQ